MKFFAPLQQNHFKIAIIAMICWFFYSIYAIIINVWQIPIWLAIIGLAINLISLKWLISAYFGKINFMFKLETTILLAWFCPVWIYLDITQFSPTLLVQAETFLVDSTMLVLLWISNIYKTAFTCDSPINEPVKQIDKTYYFEI